MNQQQRPQITCGFHDHLRPAAGQSKLVKQKSVKIEECRTDKQIEFLQNVSVIGTCYNVHTIPTSRHCRGGSSPRQLPKWRGSQLLLCQCALICWYPSKYYYIVGWPIGRVVCIGRRRVGSTSEVAAGL